MRSRTADPVGVTEIAERLHVRRDTVNKWRERHADFPEPRWTVSGYLAWDYADVVAWIEKTGRR